MKYLRTFVLVLLTVLLPVRGAVAAAMLCPGQAAATSELAAAARADHAPHALHAGSAMDAHHGATPDHAPEHASEDAPSGAHASACPCCAGGCSVTPLAFALPAVAGPILVSSAVFPVLIARFHGHHPRREDRPPRTI